MAWLGTWAKRLKVTVDNTNVDTDLTHFPVTIVLGTSVGQSAQDLSVLFDDLGANSLKIAITKADGTTQIYGEIEAWDSGAEKAVVRVSKSDLTVTSATVTELYLYFDPSQPDNTTYIGVTGDAAAQNVWDSNFKAVYHMAQDPSGGVGSILDSTSNGNDGTPQGSMVTGDLVDGTILGKAIDFNGTNQYIIVPDSASLDIATKITLECVVTPSAVDNDGVVSKGALDSSQGAWALIAANDIWFFRLNESTSEGTGQESGGVSAIGVRDYVAGTYDAANMALYENSSSIGSSAFTVAIDTNNEILCLGAYFSASSTFAGLIEEIRISDIDRSGDWIKATDYAEADDILTFSDTESYYEPVIPEAAFTMEATSGLALLITIPEAVFTMEADMGGAFVGIPVHIPDAVFTLEATLGLAVSFPIPEAVVSLEAGMAEPLLFINIAIPAAEFQPVATVGGISEFVTLSAAVVYFLTLTGAADSLSDLELPMESFTSTRRTGNPTYLSCNVPTTDFADDIAARLNGNIKIDQAYTRRGVVLQRETIIETELTRPDVYRGGRNSTVVLIGYSTETFTPKTIELSGAVSVSVIDGVTRYRLAQPNIYLNPGDTAIIGEDSILVDSMSYAISVGAGSVDISGTAS